MPHTDITLIINIPYYGPCKLQFMEREYFGMIWLYIPALVAAEMRHRDIMALINILLCGELSYSDLVQMELYSELMLSQVSTYMWSKI